jgi:tetratricopeptide (TPR) repeat protein
LELDPDGADTHLFYAHLLSNTGRHAEALAEAKRARELDPLNLRINALEAQFLIHAGRTDEALTRLQETLQMDTNYFLAHLYSSSAYIEKGMYSEAISEARRAREISGARSTYAEAFLGYALAKSGKEAEARSVLEGLLKSPAERYVSPYHIALVYNGLGEHDEALAWLEQSYAQRSPGIVFLKVEPKWNDLRSAPRFQDLLRRVGLPL